MHLTANLTTAFAVRRGEVGEAGLPREEPAAEGQLVRGAPVFWLLQQVQAHVAKL